VVKNFVQQKQYVPTANTHINTQASHCYLDCVTPCGHDSIW
jgi:hypothetical protein